MNLNRITTFFVFTLICIGASSCSAILGNGISKEEKSIPPEFGGSPGVLVIGSMNDESNDEKIKKIVSEYYHGETIFATYTDLGSEKFNEFEKYRYRFFVLKGFEYAPGPNNNPNRIRHTYSPIIRDMKTGEGYKYRLLNYNLKKVVKEYMKELEKERLGVNNGK